MTIQQDGAEELPQGWVRINLGNITKIIGGGTPSREEPDYFNGDIVWLTPTEIPKNTVSIISDSKERISQEGFNKSSTKLIPVGSVLMTSRASIGFVAIAGTEVTTNQGFASFVCSEAIYNLYLAYWFWHQREYLTETATGTTFKEISKATLKEIVIPLPPLPAQERIVAAIEEQFTRLDAGIAALRSAQVRLRRYRAAVLKAASEGRLVPQDPTDEPASELLKRILAERYGRWEESESAKGKLPLPSSYKVPAVPEIDGLPELPAGWAWARAEQLCDFITKGTTPSPDKLISGSGDIPYIKVYNLTLNGALNFSYKPTFIAQQTHSGELARSKVYPGDILMNIVGPPLGKVSIVPNIYPEWNINQAIAIFRSFSGLDRKFLSICLLSENVLRWAIRRAKTTAGQTNLTLEICRDLPLPLPPLAEQERIVAEAERRLSVVAALEVAVEANLKRAERLRQSILKQAFAGKLVPHDPSDEPASALLERIKAAQPQVGTKPAKGGRGRKAAKNQLSLGLEQAE